MKGLLKIEQFIPRQAPIARAPVIAMDGRKKKDGRPKCQINKLGRVALGTSGRRAAVTNTLVIYRLRFVIARRSKSIREFRVSRDFRQRKEDEDRVHAEKSRRINAPMTRLNALD